MIARWRLVALAVLAANASAAASQQPPAQPAATRARTLSEDLQLFSQVLNQIRVNHPDSMDTHAMMMAAIEGMVRATDPHSYVIPAIRLDATRHRAMEEGKLSPVPIQFVYAARRPTVASVAPGTQAAGQDVRVGDELVAIDGVAPGAESADELDMELAGPKGSSVTLKFRRRRLDGTFAVLDRRVKREAPDEITAVPVAHMLDATTGYIRITTFANTKVADDVHDAVQRLERAGMKRLLLDLRDNGGGIVTQAGDVAGEFLPKDAVVYTTQGRKASVNKTVKVSRSFWRSERRYPLVVLVNHGTASASELVSGALQDHDRALIIGRPTFGKALLMQGMPLTDGSLMMLVIGQVRTPCGRVVQRSYRGVRQVDYWRGAEAERDTAGRPSCRTTAGRTVYGGGGIYPDVVLDHAPPEPVWLTRVMESEVPLKWAGARLADGAAPSTVDAYLQDGLLTSDALAAFRTFARSNGGDVPDGPDADARLRATLPAILARARLGESAYYRVLLRDDPWIRAAIASFDRAALLSGPAAP